MMGNSRFLFNKAEIEQLLSDDSIRNGYQGQICYIDLADDTSLSDIASLIAGGSGDYVFRNAFHDKNVLCLGYDRGIHDVSS